MPLSHFTAALLFAVATTVVFAVTSRNTDRDRFFYGLWVFALFLIITIGIAWLMHFLRR
ncbi:MAG: hypothetical protein HY648_01895 [Acidobacteria bacterium]|nr:hypothetical protein [Acidobacteriota bacterium]